jgi:hypothetical protein
VDDLSLLRLELDTLWVTDATGALLHCRTPDGEPAPQLVVAACAMGVVWAPNAALGDPVRRTLASWLDDEPGGGDLGWTPRCGDALIDALGAVDLAEPHGGPCYVIERAPVAPVGGELRSSASTDLEWLRGRLPERDRALAAPWVVAIVDGAVAAVCETARSAPTAVEAGVWTYEPHRRLGLGAAVTAAWGALVSDRTAFYSTSWTNAGSQGVARRLELRPLGHWWQLSQDGRDDR